MTPLNTLVPLLSSIISFIFAVVLFKRYSDRGGAHLLLWGIGMVFFCIGGFCEAYSGALGANEIIFRIWYLSGAILVAAWLGQGTVYLLAKRKWANITMAILLGLSLFAAFRVFTAELDPSLMTTSVNDGSELSSEAIITPGIRFPLTPIFNLYGTVALVGGAVYSAYIFWRKRILLHRTIGNIMIAVGALAVAFGGFLSLTHIPGALYIGELLGVTLIFAGFIRATTPMKKEQSEIAPSPSGD
jgi:MFS family permease